VEWGLDYDLFQRYLNKIMDDDFELNIKSLRALKEFIDLIRGVEVIDVEIKRLNMATQNLQQALTIAKRKLKHDS